MAVVERPDGTIVLPPDSRRVRKRRFVLAALLLPLVVGALVVLAGTLNTPAVTWTDRLIPLVAIGVIIALSLLAIRLPSLKADATQVRVVDPLGSSGRMLRSDLGFIFRGQMLRAVRGGSFWDKSYIFASSDRTVMMSTWAFAFTDDDVSEFAKRLQVPIRGDFSVQVNDRIAV